MDFVPEVRVGVFPQPAELSRLAREIEGDALLVSQVNLSHMLWRFDLPSPLMVGAPSTEVAPRINAPVREEKNNILVQYGYAL
jgi:hypothetical protein